MLVKKLPVVEIAKINITILFSVLFGLLCSANIAFAVVLSFGLFAATFSWFLLGVVNEKKIILFIFLIYTLLPSLWGARIIPGVPVLKSHRVVAILLILLLLKKGELGNYFINFFKENIFSIPILLILISVTISTVLSSGVGSSVNYLLSFIFEKILLAIIIFNVFKKREDIEKLINVLCISVIIVSFFGLYEKITEFNVFTIFGTYNPEWDLEHQMRGGEIRINGPFAHSIAFGTSLSMLFPLFLYKYKNDFLKLIASTVIILPVIYFTQSRASQIGFLIVVALHYLFIEKKNLNIIFISILPLFVLKIHKIFVFFRELNPFTVQEVNAASSSDARLTQFLFYKEFIKDNIIFGAGYVNAPYIMRGNYKGGEGDYNNSIDNFYLLYSFFYGLVGLLTWIYLTIEIFRKSIKYYGRDIFKETLVFYLLSAIVSFTIINVVVGLFSYHYIFWIYIGILTRLLVNRRDELTRMKINTV